MAINLDKHKSALLAAWKDVLDDKSDTNWYVYKLILRRPTCEQKLNKQALFAQ